MDRHNPKAVYMYAINDCSICNMQYDACNFYKFSLFSYSFDLLTLLFALVLFLSSEFPCLNGLNT